MSFGMSLGAFAEGFADSRKSRKDREERAEDRARQDRILDIYEKNGMSMPDLGAIPPNGGTGASASEGGYVKPHREKYPLGTAASEAAAPSRESYPLGQSAGRPVGRDAFIRAMMPHAIRVSERTGIDPRLIIAQSAQETGWGKSAPGNNYFGIKSHGKSGGNTMATNEVVNGKTVRINDSFRAYDDIGASVDGYGEFLQANPRYRPMMQAQGLDAQLAALGRSGYATDPNYSKSVGAIAASIELPRRSAPPNFELLAQPGTPLGAHRPAY